MDNNLRKFRSLSTLNKIEFINKLGKEEGPEAIDELLKGMHKEELQTFITNFDKFAGEDGEYNRYRRNLYRASLDADMYDAYVGSPIGYFLSTLTTTLMTTRINNYERVHSDEKNLKESLIEGIKLVYFVLTDYAATTYKLQHNYGRTLRHYIVTLENADGIHSFCWNKNSKTLIYGLDDNPLDYIKLKTDDESVLAEVLQSILNL